MDSFQRLGPRHATPPPERSASITPQPRTVLAERLLRAGRPLCRDLCRVLLLSLNAHMAPVALPHRIGHVVPALRRHVAPRHPPPWLRPAARLRLLPQVLLPPPARHARIHLPRVRRHLLHRNDPLPLGIDPKS